MKKPVSLCLSVITALLLISSISVQATSSQCFEDYLKKYEGMLKQYDIQLVEAFPTLAVAYFRFDSPSVPLYIYIEDNTYYRYGNQPISIIAKRISSKTAHCGCTYASEGVATNHMGFLCARGA